MAWWAGLPGRVPIFPADIFGSSEGTDVFGKEAVPSGTPGRSQPAETSARRGGVAAPHMFPMKLLAGCWAYHCWRCLRASTSDSSACRYAS